MSKIICDICGTAYPETADQCPICGCAKGENPQVVAEDTPQESARESVRTPVKGGRFSKANVRKRNKAAMAASRESEMPEPRQMSDPEKANRGLTIVAIILLLAIVAMIAFIYIRYFMPRNSQPNNGDTAQTTTQPADDTTAAPETDPPTIACQDLTLTSAIVELKAENEAWLLEVNVSPENTTDTLTFTSSDPSVVTVTDQGRLTAVGPGQAVIIINCGNQQTKCRVVCNFPEDTLPPETTVPEVTEPEVTVDPDVKISLNREDFTMTKKGETWQLYNGTAGKNLVTFTSSDETVATVEAGLVTAVGRGICTITAEYGEQKVECIVRCNLPAEEEEGGNDDNGGNSGITEDPVCTISHTDVTIAVGETFKLTLKDGGNVVSVTWKVADSSVCTVSGNTVTGKASGTTTISVSYGGNTYTCIVRVK